jgi:hypothetical protein
MSTTAAATTTPLSYKVLSKQNSETTTALIDYLASNEGFLKLSEFEGNLIVTRDQEDAEKLQKGIDFAKSKGVIDPNFIPEPYVHLDVMGKTPDQVADEILATVHSHPDNEKCGSAIVLCGLSGTGKVNMSL